MRIIVSGYVGKKITGIGRSLIELLDHTDDSNDYIVYVNHDLKSAFQFHNSRIQVKSYSVSKNSSLGNLLWVTFVFPLKAKSEHADRALIPNFTLLLIKFCKTDVILHDLIEFHVPDKFSKLKMFYRKKLADPITARRADRLITDSENSKQDIVRFLHISPEKITVLFDGVDRSLFKKMNQADSCRIFQKNNWPADYILYAGTLDHPGKNAIAVIRAFEQLKKTNKYFGSLVLAGMPGKGYEYIQDQIEHSPYRSSIVMTGYVTDPELIALYSNCRVFCYLSLYEGFGMPPLEAMACGAKVIVSNTSSLPEVVGNAGKLVNPLNQDDIVQAICESLGHDPDQVYIDTVEQQLKKFDYQALGRQFSLLISR